ncbi:hypothetical protein EDC01DRAFT_781587 [Geopyxis carbonaria]|nr:hypothetical protein EDC01DRAFT_781587 [Geopyxis carbonaria]
MATIAAPRPSVPKSGTSKRPRSPSPPPAQKRQKTAAVIKTDPTPSSLPSDFFGPTTTDPSAAPEVDALDAEWASFQAEVVQPASTAAVAAATIVAAPVLNGAGEDDDGDEGEDAEKGRKEGEAEKQEAQERLLDEFEEMESLEARVRRLKEKREALRAAKGRRASGRLEVRGEAGPEDREEEHEDVEDGNDDDDDDEEEEDDFFLRGR